MKSILPPILEEKIVEINYWKTQAKNTTHTYKKLYFLEKVNISTSEFITLLYNLPSPKISNHP